MKAINSAATGALAHILQSGPMSAGKMACAWNAAVGAAVHRATTVSLENGTLVVEARSAQWAREVSRSSTVILGRLQRLLGDDVVTRITIRAAG